MKPFNEITIFENRRRVRMLNEFIDLSVRYIRETHPTRAPEDPANPLETRSKINRMSQEVSDMISAANQSTAYGLTPTADSVFAVTTVDLILNHFDLLRRGVEPHEIIDVVQRAIGVYEADQARAKRRTFNPLFWIGTVITEIARLPFKFLNKIGFNAGVIEVSFFGKILTGIFQLATGIGAILGVLKLIGKLDPFLEFVGLK